MIIHSLQGRWRFVPSPSIDDGDGPISSRGVNRILITSLSSLGCAAKDRVGVRALSTLEMDLDLR